MVAVTLIVVGGIIHLDLGWEIRCPRSSALIPAALIRHALASVRCLFNIPHPCSQKHGLDEGYRGSLPGLGTRLIKHACASHLQVCMCQCRALLRESHL